ncbi:hypothetical protein D3C72_2196500 [compost metagenome]
MIDDKALGERAAFFFDFFYDIQDTRDRLIIGRVNSKEPLVFEEELQDGFEFGFHIRR